jgi:hypothetical protein
LVRPDIDLVKQALIQIHEKRARDKEKKDQLMQKGEGLDVDELLEKYKALDAEMIAEKDWKFASYNAPIELHVELIKLCYGCKLWTEFEALLDPALVRLKFRRYEVPYIATVDVSMSGSKMANVPNGFEKLPKDMNAANLRIELKKLRASSKKGGSGPPGQKEAAPEEEKKAAAPAKKGGKPDPKDKKGAKGKQEEAKKQEEPEEAEADDIKATEWELEQIKHIYVNLLLQRTKNAQNAIVGLDVVMADETNGPELGDNHFAVAVPIRMHPGVYEKNQLIPYVVFRRTANALIDEEDCLSAVTDVQVLMG